MTKYLHIITIFTWLLFPTYVFATNATISIAVMNFDNRSPTGQWQWLSKGLADMLITDLSQCTQLHVVERERMQALFEEMKLSTSGIIEVSMSSRFGKAAKVEKALFGSFLKKGENLEIEAHLIDVTTEKLVRVEWVRGKAEDLLKLEKELAFKIIENLHIPITEAEKESIRYVPTDSIRAVEHFYTGLDHYDKGKYYKAFVEFRKASKKDKEYAEAGLWVATIYSSMGRYHHAAAEYESLLSLYPAHKLADKVLFRLARLYDKKLALIKPAIENYRKLADRYRKSSHAVTSQYRLARLQELKGASLIDVYKYYQAVSKYSVTAFGEGQHDLAHIAFEKAKIYYAELFNQFNGFPPPVSGVVVLSPESPTFYRNYSSGAGEDDRTGSWGYYNSVKEAYIFRAPEGYVFKEFHIEMTRSPSEKKRSGNLSFVAQICCREIDLSHYPPSRVLAIDDSDPLSVNKVIALEKETNLVQVHATDLFSALVSWKLTAEFSPSSKVSRIPSLRTALGRHIIRSDLGRKNLSSRIATEGGMYNIALIQDYGGTFRLVYNNVARGRDSYGQVGTDPDIYIMSSDDGEQWGKPFNLSINSMHSDLYPSLIQNMDGVFWLSWLSRRKGGRGIDIWISSSRNCQSWTMPRKVDSGLPGPPKRSLYITTQTLFQDFKDEYWIIFENQDLYAIHSSDCTNWSKPINITKENISGNRRFPIAFQDRYGIYRVVWGEVGFDNSEEHRYISMATSNDGKNWKKEKIEFASQSKSCLSFMSGVSFIQDRRGRYLLLFNSKGVRYSMTSDCKRWSEPKKIKEGTYHASMLFQDNHGEFWLIPREKMDDRFPLLIITNSVE